MGPRVGIRHFTYDDSEEFTALAAQSREYHRPWLFLPDTAETYATYATRLIEDPTRAGFLVCERESGRIAGFININNIVGGSFRSGALGYGAFAHAAGRGLMSEGLGLEGFSPDFLFIDGAWRDHERWAITQEMLDRRE